MKNNNFTNICISIDENMIPAFFYFLEKGVKKEINVGSDIKTMLSDQLNVSTDYIDNRIKTMFLDGRPVGDINSTIINDGSTLALSAAMPGLAGATFRRLEDTVSSQCKIDKKKEIKKSKQENGIIIIKLFNLVLRELGPAFLKSGVLISKEELTEFLSRQSEKFKKACKSVKINDRITTIEALKQVEIPDGSDLFLVCVTPD
ncbi:MAG: hypothetical protein KAR45_01125 [Desulfobacteraceae bacterium]|nr:hypothetical protein [Desulfobacteraceae bacterium]